MKIGISGVQGVGKTTLIEALKKDHIFKNYNFTKSPARIAKDRGFQINEDGDDETQKEITKLHIKNLKMQGDYIYDRCLLDCLCYTKFLFLENKIKKGTLDFVESRFLKHLRNYNLICYIASEFELVDNGIRSTSIHFRDEVQTIFDYYIKKYNLEVLKLSGSVDERIEQLKTRLNISSK